MGNAFPSRRILVVDDNVDAAELVAQLLEFEGYVVATAHGGAEALTRVVEFAPDVVFLDLGMPGMDGYQVAVALRADPAQATLRIVALTAWGDDASKARVVASGFDAHMVKPASIEILLSEAASRRPGFQQAAR